MTFGRRLRLYLIGVLFGAILVWFMLLRNRERDLDGWLPEERIKTSLSAYPLEFSEEALCKMECRGISREDVLVVLKTGEVKLGESNPRSQPCKTYVMDGINENPVRVYFGACDTTTVVMSAAFLKAASPECDCG